MVKDKSDMEQKCLNQVLNRMINLRSIRRQPEMTQLKDVEILQPSTQSSDQMLLPHLSKDGQFGDAINKNKLKDLNINTQYHPADTS